MMPAALTVSSQQMSSGAWGPPINHAIERVRRRYGELHRQRLQERVRQQTQYREVMRGSLIEERVFGPVSSNHFFIGILYR